ncbi:MAG: RNA methyltransferase [Rikenellaceae bacterium]
MITRAEIELIKSLDKKRKRAENALFLVEGEKLSLEVLNSGMIVSKLYYLPAKCSKELIAAARSKSVDVSEVTASEMERISYLKTPTAALMLVEIEENELDCQEVKNELTLALDDVQDPGNLGTIVRLADWFGIKNIICSMATVDIYNPKVVQATMGSITRVKVHYMSLIDVLSDFKKEGVPIYTTSLGGDDISEKKIYKKGVVVMGNEGNGVSKEIDNIADERFFIPQFPKDEISAESLNVGVATAILCYLFRFGR